MKMKFNFIMIARLFSSSLSVLALAFLGIGFSACFAEDKPVSIQDNSFLIEEAYNQEKSIVQHINTFTYYTDSHDWAYSFTQEWPMGGQRHQFSYTLSSVRPGAFSSHGPGFGDALINYRY